MKNSGSNRVDFAGEASERIETVRQVLESGRDPKIGEINELFRAFHSLKGLAGLSGLARFGGALHEAENLLDAVRLSKVPWTDRVRGALSRFTDAFEGGLSASGRSGSDETFPMEDAVALLSAARQSAGPASTLPLSKSLDLPEHTLTCLSEYEESRLRVNLSLGVGIYAIEASFEIDLFEDALKRIGARLNEAGEWIATLPQAEGFTADRLSFQLLAAAAQEPSNLGHEARIHRVDRIAAAPEIDSIRSPSAQSVRLDIERLDQLLAEVEEARAAYQKLSAELARVEVTLPPVRKVRLSSLRERLSSSIARLTRQAAAVQTVPISTLASRLQRAAARLLEASGKKATFLVEGGDVEIDRNLAEDLADPLLHLVRNAIDHGLETLEERQASGKPLEARLTFAARTRGSRLSVSIIDDGRGIAEERVAARARELGWLGKEIPEREKLHEFLFRPGFSTASSISEVSGRGVGLDVVAERVAARHGEVHVDSRPGEGTRFHIVVPVASSVFDALIVEEHGRLYAFPMASVARVERDAGATPAIALSQAIDGTRGNAGASRMRVVLPDSTALSVGSVLRQEMLVVRSLGTVSAAPFLIGASEGEGDEAILVLDPRPLLRLASARGAA